MTACSQVAARPVRSWTWVAVGLGHVALLLVLLQPLPPTSRGPAGHSTPVLQVKLLVLLPPHRPIAGPTAGPPAGAPAAHAERLPRPSSVVPQRLAIAAPAAQQAPAVVATDVLGVAPVTQTTPTAAEPVLVPERAPAPVLAAVTEPPNRIAHADHRQCNASSYPAALRERGIEGSVTLRVKVDAEGRPADVQLLAGSGWRLFDDAALQRVRGCRFIPALRDGLAVDSWVEFPVRFALAG